MNISEWESYIKNTKRPALVEFWAPWCGPCKIMEPGLIRIAGQFRDQVDLVRINADQSPDVIQKLNILGIPTMVAFANGTEIFRRVGLQNERALVEVFQAVANERKPDFTLSGRDRMLRGIFGFAATAIGAATGPNILIMFVGGILIFSAVYDRCPIYRAVTAKLREIFAAKTTHKA